MLPPLPQPIDHAREGSRPRVQDHDSDRFRPEIRDDSRAPETSIIWEFPKRNDYVDMYVGGWQ